MKHVQELKALLKRYDELRSEQIRIEDKALPLIIEALKEKFGVDEIRYTYDNEMRKYDLYIHGSQKERSQLCQDMRTYLIYECGDAFDIIWSIGSTLWWPEEEEE